MRDLEAGMMELSLHFLGEVIGGRALEKDLTQSVIAALDHLVGTMQNPLLMLSLGATGIGPA